MCRYLVSTFGSGSCVLKNKKNYGSICIGISYVGSGCFIICNMWFCLVLQISGMTCSSCVNVIEGRVKKLAGVQSITVGLATSQGRIEYDAAAIGPRDIIQCISVSLVLPSPMLPLCSSGF